MNGFLQDLRYALRMLRRNPGFAAVAIITLALGLGGVTAIFSAVHSVLLKPLPYDDPDALVWVWESNAASHFDEEPASLPNFADWRDQSTAFESMAAFTAWRPAMTGTGEPVTINAIKATFAFFSVLHVNPMIGRAIASDE